MMIKKLKNSLKQFVYHFGYGPNFPQDMNFNQEEFADFLLKCTRDNFDYTIEKYGTIPRVDEPLPEIIVD